MFSSKYRYASGKYASLGAAALAVLVRQALRYALSLAFSEAGASGRAFCGAISLLFPAALLEAFLSRYCGTEAFRFLRRGGLPKKPLLSAVAALAAINGVGAATDIIFYSGAPYYPFFSFFAGGAENSAGFTAAAGCINIIIMALAEEIFFRGALLNAFYTGGKVYYTDRTEKTVTDGTAKTVTDGTAKTVTDGAAFAAIAQAALFALYHGSVPALAYTMCAGLIFAYFTIKSGSVWYAAALHIVNNLLAQII